MKRHAIMLLVHPFKNGLVPRSVLKESLDRIATRLIAIATEFPAVRLNVVLPGYQLECLDPVLLLKLRELTKRGTIEWLTTGYTEPFLSISPRWLIRDNLRAGVEVYSELLNCKVRGFAAPFSNWEPACIDLIQEAGLRYATISRQLLLPEVRERCGAWITEQAGSALRLFPAHQFNHYSAPANTAAWIETMLGRDQAIDNFTRMICLEYQIPLQASVTIDPFVWLMETVRTLDAQAEAFATIRGDDYLVDNPVLGIQYLPPGIIAGHDTPQSIPSFLNTLYTHDQAGIMQRRFMEVCDNIAARRETKQVAQHKKNLFFLQDINQFLLRPDSGFSRIGSRLWFYEKLIDIERDLHQTDKSTGGQIRITDFLKNGGKSIVMANAAHKICIDHKNGGHIIEWDFRPRGLNLCAGYNPEPHHLPQIVVAGKSRTAFIDHLLTRPAQRAQFVSGTMAEAGDFLWSPFDYSVKKSGQSVKALLRRSGTLLMDEKNYPLQLEKVFGLEKDSALMSFAYQFSNPTMTTYSFTLAIELTLSLPGAAVDQAQLSGKKSVQRDLLAGDAALAGAAEWSLIDLLAGVRLRCQLQKAMDIWVFPADGPQGSYQGLTVVMLAPVVIEGSKTWGIAGKFTTKKIRRKESSRNEI